MSKRIRYEYIEFEIVEGTRVPTKGRSRQLFKVLGTEVTVFIDLKAFKFELVDPDANILRIGGKTKGNLHVLKRQVKKELESLGVVFDTEKRVKRTERANVEEN